LTRPADFLNEPAARCINSGMRIFEVIDADAWLARKKERRGATISAERRELMALIYNDAERDLAELDLERARLELGQISADIMKTKADAAKSWAAAEEKRNA
jgi:hypothetical protein